LGWREQWRQGSRRQLDRAAARFGEHNLDLDFNNERPGRRSGN
jgi:hypothetical protein